MFLNYESALLSPEISWDTLTASIVIPSRLYKYQSFIKADGNANPYWIRNMEGQFHMSLGCEFEDTEDCKPYFDRQLVVNYIDEFLQSFNTDFKIRSKMREQLDSALTNDYFASVTSRYQGDIRIGCFTDSSDNEDMWIKYAMGKSGYCIEYDTSKAELFQLSTLPVLYQNQPYNCSFTLASTLILDASRIGKKRTFEENFEIYKPIYEKIHKTAYIPVFIKQKERWDFEREYRMFLLKQRNTRNGMIEASQHLDSNYNLNLGSAVSSIYIGENFSSLNHHRELLETVIAICKTKRIKLFQKVAKDNGLKNSEIIL